MTIVFIVVPIVDSVIKSFLDFRIKNIISGQPGNGIILQLYQAFSEQKLMGAIIATFSFVILLLYCNLFLA